MVDKLRNYIEHLDEMIDCCKEQLELEKYDKEKRLIVKGFISTYAEVKMDLKKMIEEE